MSELTDYSNLQIGNGLNIEKYTLNSDTVLNVFGTGVTNYSSYMFENFIYLLSNFSGPYPPGSNFSSFYKSSSSWIYSGENLSNEKTLLKGQFWYQNPTMPLMSDTVYNIVSQLNSDISSDQKTNLENQLLNIYQNSTSFQNTGNLYVLNSPTTSEITPLTYNLRGYGIISVFDITQLGWSKVSISNESNAQTNLSLTTSGTSGNTSIDFYTASDGTTLTSSISGNSGTSGLKYSGNLNINTGNYSVSANTISYSSTNTLNLTAKTITLNGNAVLSNVVPTNNNSQQIATTSFVNSYIQQNAILTTGGTITGVINVPDPQNDTSKEAANAEYVNNQITKLVKNNIIPVTNYIDNLTNDITNAITSAISAGLNYIYIPSGNYIISKTIPLSEQNLTIFGNGIDTIITQTFDGDLFSLSSGNISFKNLQIQSNVARTTGYVINSSGNDNITIDNIFMNTNDQQNNFSGFNIDTCNNLKIQNCNILQNNGIGIKLSNISYGIVSDNIITDCGIYSPGSMSGIDVSGTNKNLKINDNLSGNSSSTRYQKYGIIITTGSTNISLTNNIFYGTTISVPSDITNVGNIVN